MMQLAVDSMRIITRRKRRNCLELVRNRRKWTHIASEFGNHVPKTLKFKDSTNGLSAQIRFLFIVAHISETRTAKRRRRIEPPADWADQQMLESETQADQQMVSHSEEGRGWEPPHSNKKARGLPFFKRKGATSPCLQRRGARPLPSSEQRSARLPIQSESPNRLSLLQEPRELLHETKCPPPASTFLFLFKKESTARPRAI
jgi:hypothetical protein